ncbi:hypothetical protein BV22DRAFT_1038537 [Leucogyrophana mollusca]|uniref:Uncharacterized protein n=1 Tax=Leucogyrophana mollusca TaxID=85980 RepID=A0ACB8B8F0_9AGAM|nr:hypothetical protein BV22DRAFT_1038537 [Leucogyrophana mollusca]
MSWSASVLSTVSSDTEPTVVLTFDSAKYVFNVGENTTRAFLQSRRNWKKTRGIFLTSVGTQRASGLPGLLMTFADSGLSSLNIVGPSGLLHFMAAMRKYTFRDNLAVNPIEVALTPAVPSGDAPLVYKDENVSVYAVPIVPQDESSDTPSGQGTSSSAMSASNQVVASSRSASKRKRTPSPSQPSKRFVRGPDLDLLSSLSPESALSKLQDLMNKTAFEPSSLSGEMAQAWRRFIVQTMFPGIKSALGPSGCSSEDSKGGSKKKDKSNPDPPELKPSAAPKIAHIAHPPGFNKQLPILEDDLILSTDPLRKATLAYAVMGPRVRGKFDSQKANALGLKAGPLRSKVARGETVIVTVEDGQGNVTERTVRPEDCMGQSESPGVILLLDIPTRSHIPSLLSSFTGSAAFAKYQTRETVDHALRTVFHICGEGVLEDERYKTFMNGFGEKVHHVVASREHISNPITFTSAAFNQLRLNQLDENIFPIPNFVLQAKQDIGTISDLPIHTTAMVTNTLVDIRPPRPPVKEKDAEAHDLFHPSILSTAPLVVPDLTRKRFAEARARVQGRQSPTGPGGDVIICTLGTGSAIPSKYRNVSGTLIQIPDYGNVLLDAGEGTWGQLSRNFGDDVSATSSVWKVLRDLRCIFISHIHGDHHIGLAKILAMRRRLDPLPSEPLYLVANQTVFLYLRDYAAVEDLGFGTNNGVLPILNDAIHWRSNGSTSKWRSHDAQVDQQSSQDAVKNLCRTLGLESLTTVDVEHRAKCHGLIIKHKDGWSIVFSGDTVPTNKLVRAGANATLLIHEATMADDQVEMARAKMHSTFGQAIGIGKSMKAQNILLTHFSARYPKMPPPSVLATDGPDDPTLALAFDMANIRIGDMWKMNAYMGAIEQSFIDSPEDGDANEAVMDVTQVDIS